MKALLGVLLAWTSLACSASTLDDAGGPSETTGFEPGDAWVRPGHGKEAFHPIEAGDDYPITLGGQGAYMFTLPLQAGGFSLPGPSVKYDDPSYPTIDVSVDIEGWGGVLDVNGHFSSVRDYPVTFRVLDDGTYEYVRVSLLLPDDLLVFDDILGDSLTLRYSLRCGDGQVVEDELPLFVSLSD